MENASKALAIAGSILIAIMIIAALLLMVQNIGNIRQQENIEKRKEQILAFNKEFESYDKKLMRGTDVVTVVNKANNNNLKSAYDENGNIINQFATVTTYITLTTTDIYGEDTTKGPIMKVRSDPYKIGNYNMKVNNNSNKYNKNTADEDTLAYDSMIEDPIALKTFKRRFFKCTEITYNDDGIVDGMSFVEVDVGDIPGY